MDKKRKQPSPVSFYLGKDETARRKRALDDLAKRLNVADRSKLIQQIADGTLVVQRAEKATA